MADRQKGKPAEPWKLSGHGIGIPAMQQSVAASGGTLGMLPVSNKGSGAFTQLAEILGSGSLTELKPDGTKAAPVTVGQIWAGLPESVGYPLADPGRFPVLAVERDRNYTTYPGRWLVGELEGIPESVKQANSPTVLREFLAHYPAAGEWAAPSEAIAGLADQWWPGRGLAGLNCVTLLWPDRGEPSFGGYSEDITQHVGTAYFKGQVPVPRARRQCGAASPAADVVGRALRALDGGQIRTLRMVGRDRDQHKYRGLRDRTLDGDGGSEASPPDPRRDRRPGRLTTTGSTKPIRPGLKGSQGESHRGKVPVSRGGQ
nr:hypothetical protein [Actinospica acidithermotolerans]